MGLTCPECCYDTLQKARGNQWRCKVCGTEFSFSKLRSVLGMLVGRQFSEDFIDELLDGAQLKRTPKLGERAWKWIGKHGILYTIDVGNTWHVVVKGQKLIQKS